MAQPMIGVLASETPGVVRFVLDQVLPIVVNELRSHLSLDGLPAAYTRLILEATMGPSATTSEGQRQFLELALRFGDQLLLGEQTNTASNDAEAP